ncbi:hypothetical protein [Phenylobacterium sp.]|jgi:hypothetical protein|uniref:hypothetical protein n=1 Tax=Phenylobacterium sp. TaxID=1871053 RepID=UPI002F427FB4
MAEASDIAVYQKLTEMADELDEIAVRGASLVGNAAVTTASRNLRGMATAVYRHIMADRDKLDS